MFKAAGSFIKASLILGLAFTAEAQAYNLCNQVWTGSVERIRVQENINGETVMRLYLYPGNNAEYAVYTSSQFMADTLLKGKESGTEITGYTDESCKIKWVDFQ